jgi:hypothetical protein
MKYLPKGVSPFKSAANNWLEFHFGWEPLVKDIYDACDVINNPVKSFSYERARVTEPITGFEKHNLGSITSQYITKGKASCTQGCRVKFANPGTLHTLDQWGIINPVSLAWELVPYSFVVDWFVNVGAFISSKSDFAGMTLESTFCTLHLDATTTGSYEVNPNFSPYWTSAAVVRYVNTSRTSSLSGVALEVKRLKPPSITRAATAISLLLQVM